MLVVGQLVSGCAVSGLVGRFIGSLEACTIHTILPQKAQERLTERHVSVHVVRAAVHSRVMFSRRCSLAYLDACFPPWPSKIATNVPNGPTSTRVKSSQLALPSAIANDSSPALQNTVCGEGGEREREQQQQRRQHSMGKKERSGNSWQQMASEMVKRTKDSTN